MWNQIKFKKTQVQYTVTLSSNLEYVVSNIFYDIPILPQQWGRHVTAGEFLLSTFLIGQKFIVRKFRNVRNISVPLSPSFCTNNPSVRCFIRIDKKEQQIKDNSGMVSPTLKSKTSKSTTFILHPLHRYADQTLRLRHK